MNSEKEDIFHCGGMRALADAEAVALTNLRSSIDGYQRGSFNLMEFLERCTRHIAQVIEIENFRAKKNETQVKN